MTESFFFLILKVIWLFLPAGFANMSPIFAKKIFPRWNTPIDFGKSWHGKEIFGSHKTYRGLVSGIVIGMLVFIFQQHLYASFSEARTLSAFDYQLISPFFGAWIGFGALLCLTLIFVPSLAFVIISLLLLTVLDFAMNFIGYHLGLKNAPL